MPSTPTPRLYNRAMYYGQVFIIVPWMVTKWRMALFLMNPSDTSTSSMHLIKSAATSGAGGGVNTSLAFSDEFEGDI